LALRSLRGFRLLFARTAMAAVLQAPTEVAAVEAEIAGGATPGAMSPAAVQLQCHASTLGERSCPKGHTMKYARAVAGTCDGCLGKVSKGKLVTNCSECNWYLCTTCTPILACPSGHQLHVKPAKLGSCDGCAKAVKESTLVMSCSECNWYLCNDCQALMECPQGHALKPWESEVAGRCDRCATPTKQGELVADCRECNWFICAACHPQLHAPAEVGDVDRSVAEPLPQCPQGHSLLPCQAESSNCACDKCCRKIRKGGLASHCNVCNWSMCGECQPIRQCLNGHRLEARQATKGRCDGCQKTVLENQSVMECRRCNWYLCGSCHMAPASASRAGA